VNSSVSKKEFTVTLNEVVLDNDDLIASTTIKSEDKLEQGYVNDLPQIYINGKSIEIGAGGSSKSIGDYTVQSVMSHHLDGNFETNEDIDVKIEYFHLGYLKNNKEETKRGPWVFEFKTDGYELLKDTV